MINIRFSPNLRVCYGYPKPYTSGGTMTTRTSTLLSDSRIDAVVRWLTDGRVMGILFGLFMLAVGISIGAHFDAEQEWLGSGWWDSFAQNAGTEMLGAFLTYFLIETLVGRRRRLEEDTKRREEKEQEKDAATQDLKQRLIRQLGSQLNEDAIRAADELRARGWLTDGSLQGVSLSHASLQGANLGGADLEQADLSGANMIQANLINAKLQRANLMLAKLEGASLQGANLKGAILMAANLRSANLTGSNLQEAVLEEADLEWATLPRSVIINEKTSLPDGSYWTPDIVFDFSRFTYPLHYNFWRSDRPGSPAYRSDEQTE
jgi:hypothetical protein